MKQQQESESSETTINEMSEVQAISYARDILLACIRTLRNDDSYSNAKALCSNPGLVVLCPRDSIPLPLCITVSRDEYELYAKGQLERSGAAVNQQHHVRKRGWIAMQDGSHRSWKKRLFVLSREILSYYEKEHPNPQGLLGHIALPGTKLEINEFGDRDGGGENRKKAAAGGFGGGGGGIGSVANKAREAYMRSRSVGNGPASKYTACLVLRNQYKECVLCFDDHPEFIAWRDSLQLAIDECPPSTNLTNLPVTLSPVGSGDQDDSDVANTVGVAVPEIHHSPGSFSCALEPEATPSSPTSNKHEQSNRKSITGLNFFRGLNGQDSGPSLSSPPVSPPATPVSTTRDKNGNGKFFSRGGPKEWTLSMFGLDSTEERQMQSTALPDLRRGSQVLATKQSRPGKRTSRLSSRPRRRSVPPMVMQASVSGEMLGQSVHKSTVRVVVKESVFYKICAADPTGNEGIDTWAMLETKLVLSFLLSGGPTGRILQGEELVEMNLMEESVTNENNDKSR